MGGLVGTCVDRPWSVAYGIERERYVTYADRRWGSGWKLNPHGRRQAWNEMERYTNHPDGYADKIESELRPIERERSA